MHHELPRYVSEQVALYQGDHLLCHAAFPFDPVLAAANLRHDQDLIAIDLGGDKIRRANYAVRNGALVRDEEEVLHARGGAGYLSLLERVAREARERNLPVGISSATRLEGTVISRTVNLPVFFEEFSIAYGADYDRLFEGRARVANDTVAGICGASTLLVQQGVSFEQIAFFICGSGLGASVISEDQAIHVEAAHVPLVNALNPLGQTTRCNVPGKDYVCLERVTAARAGIEDLHRQQTGESYDGVALGNLYMEGDALATLLYDTSALTLAHATTGVMTRYQARVGDQGVVVYHGGNFEIPRYREAVTTALAAIPGPHPRVVFSRDLSSNACLDGAAVLAAWGHG